MPCQSLSFDERFCHFEVSSKQKLSSVRAQAEHLSLRPAPFASDLDVVEAQRAHAESTGRRRCRPDPAGAAHCDRPAGNACVSTPRIPHLSVSEKDLDPVPPWDLGPGLGRGRAPGVDCDDHVVCASQPQRDIQARAEATDAEWQACSAPLAKARATLAPILERKPYHRSPRVAPARSVDPPARRLQHEESQALKKGRALSTGARWQNNGQRLRLAIRSKSPSQKLPPQNRRHPPKDGHRHRNPEPKSGPEPSPKSGPGNLVNHNTTLQRVIMRLKAKEGRPEGVAPSPVSIQDGASVELGWDGSAPRDSCSRSSSTELLPEGLRGA